MARTRPAPSPDTPDALRMLNRLPGPASLMAPQAEVAWQTQKTLMEEWERYADAWFGRRREAAESAERCLERIRQAGGADGPQVNEAVSELNAWMSDEMQRLTSDARDNMEFCMRCFGLFSQNAVSAGAKLAEEAREQASGTVEDGETR